MSRYSDERRKAVVAKLLPPYNLSEAEAASPERAGSSVCAAGWPGYAKP
ncbi:MAG: hypothetical protein ACOX0Y_09250 [Thiopseudomonas sp.]